MNNKSPFNLPLLLLSLIGFSSTCQALTESEAEELADLTAVFFYLKKECGYKDLPIPEIKRALIYFAQQNHWDLANYNQINMEELGQSSYDDLSRIPVDKDKKCAALAKDSFGIMNN
ncbi:YacC family pilotin-like protein [Budviciaceae bacterium CWB-B4]|uniref:YacC family pilotin-like protein n=1 Tax=Limnobaculum xujianqingii TaxID=2738837 RepID=A0A9D7FVM5_9GAMM|nr:YacC family pilotin-like protein [Limnobaculum xujianqingii]MBK5074521.1 YacC family pilotin-like protein [Limnobaculum xujianqingii]MBK5177813.1 YacC family pilotin-like protein [Limnobaculum xujianqingii]